MKFKRILPIVLLLVLLTGCGRAEESEKTVIAAIYPIYDWTMEIIGDTQGVSVQLLSDKGVDLHSYQATAQDMLRIYECGLFLYVGGESDEWVADVLDCVPNPQRRELAILETLGDRLREEETVEGMQVRGWEEEEAYDEHVWLSLKNARIICDAICQELCALAPENRESYLANLAAYDKKLEALDAAYAQAVSQGKMDTLLFCDRFPFRYLTEDYSLNYYAAFSGCSGDSEASFATVLFLTEQAERLQVPALLILEDSDGKLARTVAGCTDSAAPEILTLDSMQATAPDCGESYLEKMEKNLEVLRSALG